MISSMCGLFCANFTCKMELNFAAPGTVTKGLGESVVVQSK